MSDIELNSDKDKDLEEASVVEAETETVDAENDEADLLVKYKKLLEESRKWEGRSKSNKSELTKLEQDAKRWAEHEESLKSETQKQAELIESLKAEASTARLQLLKSKIASERGLPADALEFITGGTEEEVASQADKILALIGSKPVEVKQGLAPARTQGATSASKPLSGKEAFKAAWAERGN